MKIESGKNRLILARATPPPRRSVLGEKEGRRWGLGGRFSEPMDIDQRTVVRPPARPCAPPSRSVLSRPVPRVALMDARLQRQGHSLTPHDVSPQPPLSSAATYRAEWGVQAAGVSKETKKGRSPSPTLLGNEVCILYQRHCVSLPSLCTHSVTAYFRRVIASVEL